MNLWNIFNKEQRSSEPIVTPDGRVFNPNSTHPDAPERSYAVARPDNLAAVRICTELRANIMSSIPLKFYKKGENGFEEEATAHPLSTLFKYNPDGINEMTPADWMKYMMLCYDLKGNFYARIVRNKAKIVVGLIPLDPSAVTVTREIIDGAAVGPRIYTVAGMGVIPTSDIIHYANYPSDGGIYGKSPITQCREEAFEASAELAGIAREFTKNSIKSKDFISLPTGLTDKQLAESLKLIANKKPGQPYILINGGTYDTKTISLSAEDAQYIGSAQFNSARIAALYGVPAYRLNLTSDRKPAASVEQEDLEWQTKVIHPLCEAFEQLLNLKLLTLSERGKYFFKFDTNAVLRFDIRTKTDVAVKMLQNGVYSRNDVRRDFGMTPIPAELGGDDFYVQVNTAPTKADTNPADNVPDVSGSLGAQ